MHLPYTDDYPRAVGIAAECLAASLSSVLWSRPLPRRVPNVLFLAGVWTAALFAFSPELARVFGGSALPSAGLWLQLSATLTTVAFLMTRARALGKLAVVGQGLLLWLAYWLQGSNDELMFAHFTWYGALLGAFALRATPRSSGPEPSARRAFFVQDAVIFLLAVALGGLMVARVFEFVIYNGDEVAYDFQANVFAHLRPYAPVPPCAKMFENYWVFTHHGRVFSQYTPGWPLFMAPFDRLHVVWLAAPAMSGLTAVGVARLSRRLASGLGASSEGSARIVALAGPIGAIFALLGPSMALNSGSRFSHTMVAGCFAWSVDAAAELATRGLSRARGFGMGLLLGTATALGLAARPADGGFLALGVFLYFAQALVRRRVGLPAFVGTSLGFVFFGGLSAVILRLQLGAWFETGYALARSVHPEAGLVLSAPRPWEVKYGVPLATGSYMWWPVAPALGVLGFVRALGGRARGSVFMLSVGSLGLVAFYSFVEFGRQGDDGFGPRYVLPTVVAQATGTAVALAPVLARLVEAVQRLGLAALKRVSSYGPAVVMLGAGVYGVVALVPLTYPIAYAEHHITSTPLRTARSMNLHDAVVLIVPNTISAHPTNLAQNPPMDPDPDVLYLIRWNARDEECARRAFPNRSWFRTEKTDRVVPVAP